jgi:hypothetical protein
VVNFFLSGDGGIGRRAGLRSQWPQGRAGSSPVLRTTYRISRPILPIAFFSRAGVGCRTRRRSTTCSLSKSPCDPPWTNWPQRLWADLNVIPVRSTTQTAVTPPAAVQTSGHAHWPPSLRASLFPRPRDLLRFLAVLQSTLSAFAGFGIHKRDLLTARMVVTTYNFGSAPTPGWSWAVRTNQGPR